MIGANKLYGFLDRLETRKPITADIFLTDFCNLKCGYCRYSHESGGFMAFPVFLDVVDRLLELGVKGLILTGGGEPTLHPDWGNITEELERRNIPYGVNTNFVKYSQFSPVFIKISLDGDAEYYKRVRGADKFTIVAENIKKFRAGLNKKTPWMTRIGVQAVAETKEQIIGFYDAVKDLPVDYIQVRPIEKIGGSKKGEFDEIIEFCRIINDFDSRLYCSYKFGYIDRGFRSCIGNWASLCVNHNAEVLYCCHRPDLIVGSLFDSDILEKKENTLVDMKLCDIPCRMTGPNIALSDDKIDYERFFI